MNRSAATSTTEPERITAMNITSARSWVGKSLLPSQKGGCILGSYNVCSMELAVTAITAPAHANFALTTSKSEPELSIHAVPLIRKPAPGPIFPVTVPVMRCISVSFGGIEEPVHLGRDKIILVAHHFVCLYMKRCRLQ
jgi:hypothetical protein